MIAFTHSVSYALRRNNHDGWVIPSMQIRSAQSKFSVKYSDYKRPNEDNYDGQRLSPFVITVEIVRYTRS